MKDNLRKNAWLELTNEIKSQREIKPGEITREQFADMMEISPRAARYLLESMIESGEISTRKVFINSRWINAYSIVNDTRTI